ncbi:MAG: hypothetical protein WC003_06220 [Terrimicrobiaceae bacterium]
MRATGHSFFILLLGVFQAASPSCAFGQAPATPSQRPPKVHLQILNGISPGPVDVAINDQVLFADAGPGQRFSAMGLPENKFKLAVIDKKTGHKKKLQLDLEEGGYYTLLLAGDFKLLAPVSSETPDADPEVRVYATALNNKSEPGQSTVRVRCVNGLISESVKIQGPDNKQWIVAPMQMEVVSGLPPNLYMKASVASAVRSLYLGQDPPAKNIAVVFYPSGDSFGFRAMTEYTPEGVARDVKQKEETTDKEGAARSP